MSEMPKEVKELIELIRVDALMELRSQINQKSTFLAQGAKLNLCSIDKDTKKVYMTFEAQLSSESEIESVVTRHLNKYVGRTTLLIF